LEERRSFAELREAVKQQSQLVRLDAERAISAIPALLENRPERSRAALEALHELIDVGGGLSDEARRRLARVDALFGVGAARREWRGEGHA
jgi:hypothetical protein